MQDVQTVLGLLQADEHAFILVEGGPGMGKTELTKRVAHDPKAATRFQNRRWFAALETSVTADEARHSIMRAIGLDPALGFDAAISFIREAPALLILDNLETPWERFDGRQKVHELISKLYEIPHLSIIASVRGLEWIGGAPWEQYVLPELGNEAGKALFCSIAGKWAERDPLLGQFVIELGGIPLAITLVARRAHVLHDLQPLWLEWERIGAALATERGYDLDRHTSLPRSIELSLRSERMTHECWTLFRLLGISPSGLSEDDRKALLTTSAFDAAQGLRAVGLTAGDWDRMMMLPPIREYAAREYPPSQSDEGAWADYLVEKMDPLAESVATVEARAVLDRYQDEFKNLEAALRHQIRQESYSDPTKAINGIGHLAVLRNIPTLIFQDMACSFEKKGSQWLHALCLQIQGDVCLRQSDYGAAEAAYSSARALYRDYGDQSSEGTCLYHLGNIALRQTRLDRAECLFIEALPILKQGNDETGEAHCIFGLADVAHIRGHENVARSGYIEALDLYRSNSYSLGEANCLQALGHVSISSADMTSAEQYFDQSISLYESIGETLGEINSKRGLGDIFLFRSEWQAACAIYEDALDQSRETKNRPVEALCLLRLASAQNRLPGNNSAQSSCDRAIEIFQGVGDRFSVATCIYTQGEISLQRDEPIKAEAEFQEAMKYFDELEHRGNAGSCLMNLGRIALLSSDFALANDRLLQALSKLRDSGGSPYLSECLRFLGDTEQALENHTRAIEYYEEAIEGYDLMANAPGKAECLRSVALSLFELSKYHQCATHLDDAATIFLEHGVVAEAADCLGKLGDLLYFFEDYAEASPLYERAQSMFEQTGNEDAACYCSNKLIDIRNKC